VRSLSTSQAAQIDFLWFLTLPRYLSAPRFSPISFLYFIISDFCSACASAIRLIIPAQEAAVTVAGIIVAVVGIIVHLEDLIAAEAAVEVTLVERPIPFLLINLAE
jgi:hypothetical protein